MSEAIPALPGQERTGHSLQSHTLCCILSSKLCAVASACLSYRPKQLGSCESPRTCGALSTQAAPDTQTGKTENTVLDSPPPQRGPIDSRQGGNGVPSAQLEQEKELAALQTIPVKEQGYESLVAWVGAAMAFGGGIWYLEVSIMPARQRRDGARRRSHQGARRQQGHASQLFNRVLSHMPCLDASQHEQQPALTAHGHHAACSISACFAYLSTLSSCGVSVCDLLTPGFMCAPACVLCSQGPEKAQEYFAGYLLEQSLSVDNLFVFILVFNYFKTPQAAQKKVLTWGIATAAVLRAIFIVAGVEMIELFQPLLIVFAAILIYSAYKIIAVGDEDDDDEDLSDNAVVKFCRRFIPTSDHYDGDRFWTTAAAAASSSSNNGASSSAPPAAASSSNGAAMPADPNARIATPLLLTLAVIELSDVLFAVDSIPAVFGVTLDPFIIYTSNIFAILSLRALYSFVSNVMSELRFLDKSVAVVLGFIGVKMLLGFADVDIPTDLSLLFVGVVLGGGVAASLLLPDTSNTE